MRKGLDPHPKSSPSTQPRETKREKAPFWVQTKLEMNQPGDLYELEADRVADQVMRNQAQSIGGLYGSSSSVLSPIAEGKVRSLHSRGTPLSNNSRTFFENRMGWGFGNVRVHTDAQAADTARSLRAKAFTFGHDISFAAGEYQPGTPYGDRLIAHELTHVVQQSLSGMQRVQREEADGGISDAGEPPSANLFSDSRVEIKGVTLSTDRTDIFTKMDQYALAYGMKETRIFLQEFESTIVKERNELAAQTNMAAQAQQFPGEIHGTPDSPEEIVRKTNRNHQMEAILPILQEWFDGLNTRLDSFRRLVYNVTVVRMAQNIISLTQWSDFIDSLTPDQLEGQVIGEEARKLIADSHKDFDSAQITERIFNTKGSYSRFVLYQQMQGRYRACTGCHYTVQAQALDSGGMNGPLLGQTPFLPTDKLAQHAEGTSNTLTTKPSFANFDTLPQTMNPAEHPATANAAASVAAIQPYLRELGPEGYQVLPPTIVGGNLPLSELKPSIMSAFKQRITCYQEFIDRLDQAAVSDDQLFLSLNPVIRDVLPIVDPVISALIEEQLQQAESKQLAETVLISGVSVATLLLAMFPPTAPVAIALGIASSAYGIYSGMQQLDRIQYLMLARGANNVVDPQRIEANDTEMVLIAFSIVMNSIDLGMSLGPAVSKGIQSSTKAFKRNLTAVKINRVSSITPSAELPLVESATALAGEQEIRLSKLNTSRPEVTVVGPGDQVIYDGMPLDFLLDNSVADNWSFLAKETPLDRIVPPRISDEAFELLSSNPYALIDSNAMIEGLPRDLLLGNGLEDNWTVLTLYGNRVNIGRTDLDLLRKRWNVSQDLNTIAVGRTTVPGMEHMTFEGGSPRVRQVANLPDVDAIMPDRPIKSPGKLPSATRHAEEGVLNDFAMKAKELGKSPEEITGTLYLHQTNVSGVCPICIQGIDNLEVAPGIFKQFSDKYPNLTLVVTSETKEGQKIVGRSSFVMRNGRYLTKDGILVE
ncbi:eCIS core domain-containing protein [Paenibacillus spongiae]|uniref:DUF4157 domain-containing protein n=1 Tax=Paenibacillus spongiae TaxID=2909671 RepID=A0ABY5S0M6_9BACL|nr:DUF4157 domain-containing protein [Paenibacillus spongiae]UVI27392.1 DUF4157 domain-containing protein [Paenibacillus spongiae]